MAPEIFESHFDTEQLRCAYWRAPTETKRERLTLVLLHESLGCIEMWKRFPAQLAMATGYDVFTYDRPGHGGSTPRNAPLGVEYNEEEALERLPRILKHNKVDNPVLIGHSAGGSMALLYAAHHPAQACITIGAHAFVEEQTLAGIREAEEYFRDPCLRQRLERYHGVQTEAVLRGWMDLWLSPAFRAWSLEWALPHIRCPVLAIHGQDDRYGSTAHASRITQGSGGPAKTMLLPACGHMPHLEQPQVTVSAIAQFLSIEKQHQQRPTQ